MNDEPMASFGDVIREARKKQGWSQGELGAKSGLSRPTIARVEANNDVTTATIAKIARTLGLKLELRTTNDSENDRDTRTGRSDPATD